MRHSGVVGHDADLLPAHDIAAEVGGEIDRLLVDHAQVARWSSPRKTLAIVNVINVAPAAAMTA